MDDSLSQKQCAACNKVLPATTEYFWRASDGKHGLESKCKVCRKAAKEMRRADYKAKQHEWYVANRESVIKRVHANPRRKAHKKASYLAHHEQNKAKRRAYGASHREQIQRRWRIYYRANITRYITNANNRRARKRNAPGSYTLNDIRMQYKRQKGKCYYCRKNVEWGGHHVDHVIPLTRNGSNDPSNLVIACPTCNLKKHDRLPHEFPEGNRLL